MNIENATRQKFINLMMSDNSAQSPAFFSRKDLTKRGWSRGLIDRILGDPDWRSPNPHFENAAPMLCWKQDRVLAAENAPAFQEHRSRNQK
jgi:hypothetical protein